MSNQLFLITAHLPQISTSETAINPDAAIRGAYVNSGSKDIGLDPQAGKYKSNSH
jgi:hypothetical protein